MEIYIFVCAVLVFAIGAIIGALTHGMVMRRKKPAAEDDGILFVDISDPENPYLHLGLSKEELVEICQKKNTATFMVVHTDKPIS